jgi:hypothetical protein
MTCKRPKFKKRPEDRGKRKLLPSSPNIRKEIRVIMCKERELQIDLRNPFGNLYPARLWVS